MRRDVSSGPAGPPDDDPISLAGSQDLPRPRPAECLGARRVSSTTHIHASGTSTRTRRASPTMSASTTTRSRRRATGGAGLSTSGNRETGFVINSMHAVPVWLNQSHAGLCCSSCFRPRRRSSSGTAPSGRAACRQPDLLVRLAAGDLQRHPLNTSRGLDARQLPPPVHRVARRPRLRITGWPPDGRKCRQSAAEPGRRARSCPRHRRRRLYWLRPRPGTPRTGPLGQSP